MRGEVTDSRAEALGQRIACTSPRPGQHILDLFESELESRIGIPKNQGFLVPERRRFFRRVRKNLCASRPGRT